MTWLVWRQYRAQGAIAPMRKVDVFKHFRAVMGGNPTQSDLEEFIAKNKARASTATLAKSKAKQLERLELTEIARDEPTARIRAPRI